VLSLFAYGRLCQGYREPVGIDQLHTGLPRADSREEAEQMLSMSLPEPTR